MSENKLESLETSDLFALRIEHKNGFVEFPTYVSTDISDWGEYLAEAEHHYKTQYPSAILSTSVGETFLEARVHTPGTISNWILSRINIVLKPRMEKSQRFLAELEEMQIPRKILNILKEDLDVEGNKKKFLNYIEENFEDIEEIERTKKALQLAQHAHRGQTQKISRDKDGLDHIPYINHPIRVAQILLEEVGADLELTQGALLHDVVEDTPAELRDFEGKFSAKVSKYVEDATRTDDETREEYTRRVEGLTGESKLIKCIDRYHNIIRCFGVSSSAFLNKYIKETRQSYLPYFKTIADLNHLAEEFEYLIDELEVYSKKVEGKGGLTF